MIIRTFRYSNFKVYLSLIGVILVIFRTRVQNLEYPDCKPILHMEVYELVRTRRMSKNIHGYEQISHCGQDFYVEPNFERVVVLDDGTEAYAKNIHKKLGSGFIDFQLPDQAFQTADFGLMSFPGLLNCVKRESRSTIFLSSMITINGFRPLLIISFIDYYIRLGLLPQDMLFTIQIDKNTRDLKELRFLIATMQNKGVYYDIFIGKWSSESLMYHQAHKLFHCTAKHDWIVIADSDEFHEYPGGNVYKFLRMIDKQGYNLVNGVFLDRTTANGELEEFSTRKSLFKQFNTGCRLHNQIPLGTPKKVMAFKGNLRINRGHHRLALCWFWKRRNYLHLTPWVSCPPPNPEYLVPFKKKLNVHHFKWMSGQLQATEHKARVWNGTAVGEGYSKVLNYLKECKGICTNSSLIACSSKLSGHLSK